MKQIILKSDLKVYVCESCLKGEHKSPGGFDHREGSVDRRDCKNLNKDGTIQCQCSEDFKELWEYLEAKMNCRRCGKYKKGSLQYLCRSCDKELKKEEGSDFLIDTITKIVRENGMTMYEGKTCKRCGFLLIEKRSVEGNE